MADNKATPASSDIRTGGAVHRRQRRYRRRMFIGRDQVTNNTINISGSDLERLADRLLGLLDQT